MNRVLGLFVLALPMLSFAQPVMGPALVGTTTVVNNSPGDQTDPHVSGDLVAYTSAVNGDFSIRYHDLLAGTDSAIPNNGAVDFLSDVSGSTIAYTHQGDTSIAIFTFNVATNGPPVEVAPQDGSNRDSATIGGNTVAWRDFGFSSSTQQAEIVAYDRVSGVATRLTNDQVMDQQPSASPSGSSIVWAKCTNVTSGCSVWSATLAGGVWTSRQLTSTGESVHPDTNDTLAVYASTRNGESDIYWQPIRGGQEQHLALTGDDRNPHIAGHLISFEHASTATGIHDIYLYDLSSNTLYAVTQAKADQNLNDISIGTGDLVRIVWSAPGSAGQEVLAFSFIAPSCGGASEALPEEQCKDPGSRPLLAKLSVSRDPAQPDIASASFTAADKTKGLLCVDNQKATAGWVTLNGQQVVDSSAFERTVTLVATTVELAAQDSLSARIASDPGTSYDVRLYGPQPTCSTANEGVVSPAALRIAGLTFKGLTTVSGNPGVVVNGIWQGSGTAMGCSASGGGVMLTGLLALLGLLLSARPRATLRVRSRRNR